MIFFRFRQIFIEKIARISKKCCTFALAFRASGCSAVGSALRSGRRGRAFESPHPDKRRNTEVIVFRLFLLFVVVFHRAFSVLCTQFGQSKQEEWNVSYSPELASESLYFGIERLCPGIGLPVHEKIKYGIIVIYKSANDGLKGISSQLFNFIEPSCQFEPCHILDAFPVEYVRQFHGKLISPL